MASLPIGREMIRLSICIATLNRADYISSTLEGLLSQLAPDVELIVVDGASHDGTDRVVAALFQGRQNCRLRRLTERGGVDLDYCKAVAMATGEYVWLMTDDDLVTPDAITTILDRLSSEPDLLVINAEVASKDCRATLVRQRLPLDHDRSFAPDQQSELLALAGSLLSFIGAVVIRRAVWMARDTDSYVGSDFVHVGVIFQKPFQRDAIVMARPLIRIRYGNSHWSRRAFDIWMKKWPALVWSFAHLSADAKRRVVPLDPRAVFMELVSMKVRGCFGLEEYHRELAPLRFGLVRRTAAFLLAAAPDVPLNAALCVVAVFLPGFPTLQQELHSSPYYFRHYCPRLFRGRGTSLRSRA
jgi:abequosyltransferase